MNSSDQDKFVAMATATARVDLPISDFQPRSQLRTTVHDIERPKFPVIDYHNHLDALDPTNVLRVMDACGVERVANITMQAGEAALAQLRRWAIASPRFSTIGWMDWHGIERPDFWQKSSDDFERLVEAGAVGRRDHRGAGRPLRAG